MLLVDLINSSDMLMEHICIDLPAVESEGHVVGTRAVMKMRNIFTSPITKPTQLEELVLVAAALQ